MNPSFIYRNLKARYRDQKQEISALLACIQPGDSVVDCGANKGSYVWTLSRAVGKNGQVTAFEPQRKLAAYLRAMVQSCGLANVRIEEKGISDHAGTMQLMIPGSDTSPGASLEQSILQREDCATYPVEVVSLDEYFAARKRRISALKIDVEGHEFAVLQGAKNILAQDGPLLVFECEQRHLTGITVPEILAWLQAQGYDGWFILRGELRPIAEFRIELHQKQQGERFWDAPDYCNNFIMKK
ncbi:MAG: FkbM family methyltransferase [Gallionella sp.]|nr:FkbM family methyltransferase [Gallionella sp.]